MNVGDLVRFQYGGVYTGIIVEVGIYAGGKDVKVLWSKDPRPYTERSAVLEVVNPS